MFRILIALSLLCSVMMSVIQEHINWSGGFGFYRTKFKINPEEFALSSVPESRASCLSMIADDLMFSQKVKTKGKVFVGSDPSSKTFAIAEEEHVTLFRLSANGEVEVSEMINFKGLINVKDNFVFFKSFEVEGQVGIYYHLVVINSQIIIIDPQGMNMFEKKLEFSPQPYHRASMTVIPGGKLIFLYLDSLKLQIQVESIDLKIWKGERVQTIKLESFLSEGRLKSLNFHVEYKKSIDETLLMLFNNNSELMTMILSKESGNFIMIQDQTQYLSGVDFLRVAPRAILAEESGVTVFRSLLHRAGLVREYALPTYDQASRIVSDGGGKAVVQMKNGMLSMCDFSTKESLEKEPYIDSLADKTFFCSLFVKQGESDPSLVTRMGQMESLMTFENETFALFWLNNTLSIYSLGEKMILFGCAVVSTSECSDQTYIIKTANRTNVREVTTHRLDLRICGSKLSKETIIFIVFASVIGVFAGVALLYFCYFLFKRKKTNSFYKVSSVIRL